MSKLIASQQKAMQAIGFYDGAIDGRWGMKSMLGMSGLLLKAQFNGVSRKTDNGPFGPFEALPVGWEWSHTGDEILFDATEVEAKREQERIASEQRENERVEAERLAGIQAVITQVEANVPETGLSAEALAHGPVDTPVTEASAVPTATEEVDAEAEEIKKLYAEEQAEEKDIDIDIEIN
jgi:hypothetical protein